MKTLAGTFLILCAALPCTGALAAQSGGASGHQAPGVSMLAPATVAVIDVQRILQESLATKSVQTQLDGQRSKFQAVISGEEAQLRQAEQDLVQSRASVTPDIYAEKEQKLREHFLTVEQHVQVRHKALDDAYADAMDRVHKNVIDIVAAVAHARGANLVIVKQQMIWSENQIDITDEVLSRLNKAMTSVQVKLVADEDLKENKPAAPVAPKGGAH